MRLVPVAALIAATTLITAGSGAQTSSASKKNALSIQPLSPMIGVYSAEYERVLAPSFTVGVGGSYWNYDDGFGITNYRSADLKVRYYPKAHPIRGFSLVGQAGYVSLSDKVDYGAGAGSVTSNASGPALGVALDYSWLLGEAKTFYLGVGLGAKKIFASDNGMRDLRLAYPTGSVSIGYAF